MDVEVGFRVGLALVVFESVDDGGSDFDVAAGVAAEVPNGMEVVVEGVAAAMTVSICFSSTCSPGS